MKYNLNDIENALIWGQNNPSSTLEQYLDYLSKTITKKELTEFSDFKYDTVNLELNGQTYDFLVFYNPISYLNLEKLPCRIAGKNSFYTLTPMPGEWYNGVVVLHINLENKKEFFTISDWPEFEGNKGLHVVGNEKLQFSYVLDVEGDDDGYMFVRNKGIIDSHNKDFIKLCDNNSELNGYVNLRLLNLKPIDNLFNILLK